jgi:hypothetical protein
VDQASYQRELAAFDEKIFLGELEVKKAEERVSELKYQKARFQLDIMVALCQQQAAAQAPVPQK